MARPDCDAAPDKVDVFKKGCREQAHFAIVVYFEKADGSLEKLLWNRALYGCRTHMRFLFRAMLDIALQFKAKGERVKVTTVSLVDGPVPWTGETESFGKEVELELRRRLASKVIT